MSGLVRERSSAVGRLVLAGKEETEQIDETVRESDGTTLPYILERIQDHKKKFTR